MPKHTASRSSSDDHLVAQDVHKGHDVQGMGVLVVVGAGPQVHKNLHDFDALQAQVQTEPPLRTTAAVSWTISAAVSILYSSYERLKLVEDRGRAANL